MKDDEGFPSTLQVMRLQEDVYRVGDYLGQTRFALCQSGRVVDAVCRSTMADWCYNLVDFCSYDRDIVSIAMSYLDRYLCTQVGQATLRDRSEFQLAVMTCMYTAVKLFEPLAIHPKTFAALSNGVYTADQIEGMEKIILQALDWRMNPPTASAFLQELVDLIPSHLMVMKPALRSAVLDLAKIQIELSVREYEFVTAEPSEIAFGSLLNAVEIIDEDVVEDLHSLLATRAGIGFDNEVMERTRTRLFEMMEKRPGGTVSKLVSVAHLSAGQGKLRSSGYTSPRSIVGMR